MSMLVQMADQLLVPSEEGHLRDRTTTILECDVQILSNDLILSWCCPEYTDVNGKYYFVHVQIRIQISCGQQSQALTSSVH